MTTAPAPTTEKRAPKDATVAVLGLKTGVLAMPTAGGPPDVCFLGSDDRLLSNVIGDAVAECRRHGVYAVFDLTVTFKTGLQEITREVDV